jgi:hypothetical protein
MVEIVIVLSVLLAVGLFGFLTTTLTPALMTEVGLWTLLVGMITGVPAGFWYHVLLYRTLVRKTQLPSNWWTSPVQYHTWLDHDELRRLQPWFRTGGIGFVLALAGGLAAMAGLLMSR